MADTDDEQNAALEPDQHLQGDDDPEALNERRGAGRWVRDNERPAAVLTPEEARREQEELEDELHEERVELAAKDEQERQDIRRRGEILARTEADEAMRLAYAAEEKADLRRRDADVGYREGRSDRAHGRHLLDEAAARPDEPGADATAAAGRRYERIADRAESQARYDDRVARGYDAEARDRRRDAAQEQPVQPPAEEAARAPSEPPIATKFVRKQQKKRVKKEQKFRPGELGNTGLGDN